MAVGLVAAGRVAAESVAEARGRRPRTWAATRIVDPAPPGQGLAARMAAPAGPVPTGPARRRAIAWAAPTTAVGLLLGAVSGGRWAWREDVGALVVSGARNPLVGLGGFAAQGVGHVIVSRRDPVPAGLLAHEAAHVRQAEVLGPFTLPLYFWWLARHGYRHHPMERGARATARRELAARTARNAARPRRTGGE